MLIQEGKELIGSCEEPCEGNLVVGSRRDLRYAYTVAVLVIVSQKSGNSNENGCGYDCLCELVSLCKHISTATRRVR